MKDDTISRQATIDGFYNVKVHEEDCTEYDIGYNDGIDYAISKLSVMPSAQRWIPTSERLPKVREWVLCQCRAGIMDVLRLTEDGYWNKNYPHAEYMSGFVIAWMPLPEPYKEEP